ncbi:uncharacterized protein LOC129764648 [Toxorhynchites rutilus septentrionalis]|uniref:uncharacterized protein LOC129764648 n=2 Tax=Toxorhynchites rutilus septentrionalis TaxID=329112 RepID=UPI0024787406|nr:uncharacterized protein LOC129764648 [Toxorhynchites rutilus septentrionalis]
MSDALENMVANMTIINQRGYLLDARLIEDLVKRLPYNLQIEWTRHRTTTGDAPSLEEMSNWLKPHAKIMRNMASPLPSTVRSQIHVHQEMPRMKCPVCSNNHKIFDCTEFKNSNIQKRCRLAVQCKICFGCLGTGHMVKDCRRSRRCGLSGCNKHHHRMLHSNPDMEPTPRNTSATVPLEANCNIHKSSANEIYYQVIPVTLQHGRHSVDTYAFLDTGSSLTLLDEEMANSLDLYGREEPLQLKWTQDVSRNELNSRKVQVRIQGSSRRSYRLDGVRTIKNLQLPTQTMNYKAMATKYPHLENLPIESYELARPTILIGLNQSHLLTAMETRRGSDNDPIAVRSKLGWFIFGNVRSIYQNDHELLQHDKELRDMMAAHFSIDEFSIRQPIRVNDNPLPLEPVNKYTTASSNNVMLITSTEDKSKKSTRKKRRRNKTTTKGISKSWFNISRILKIMMLFVMSFTLINAISIKPVDKDGLMFDHEGTCLLHRGIWQTNIQTNVVPDEDIEVINSIRNNVTVAMKDMEFVIEDSLLEQIATSVERLCDDAIDEIKQTTRTKRSKGFFGFLADLIFGSDDMENELQAMRVHEDEKIHQISESMVKMNTKASKMGEQLNERYYKLYKDMTQLKQLYSADKVQRLRTTMLETTILAREVIDGTLNRYRKVRTFPLSVDELAQTRKNISQALPTGYIVLDHPSAVKYNTRVVNGSLIITMTSVVINKVEFEVFKIIPIPRAENGSIIVTEHDRIAVGHNQDFFYPSIELTKLNDTHLITVQPELSKEVDCVAAVILHIASTRKCATKLLTTPYAMMETLSTPNTVLYYASDTKAIVIHCDNVVMSPPYEAAVVTLQPDCRIQSNNKTIHASLNGMNKKIATYFKSKYQVADHLLDEFNDTVKDVVEPKPDNPYDNNAMITVYNSLDPFHPKSKYLWRNAALFVSILMIIIGIIYLRCCRRRCCTRSRATAGPDVHIRMDNLLNRQQLEDTAL